MVEATDFRHTGKVVISENGEIVFRRSFSSGAEADTDIATRFVAKMGAEHKMVPNGLSFNYGSYPLLTGEERWEIISGDDDLSPGAKQKMYQAHDKIYEPDPDPTPWWEREEEG